MLTFVNIVIMNLISDFLSLSPWHHVSLLGLIWPSLWTLYCLRIVNWLYYLFCCCPRPSLWFGTQVYKVTFLGRHWSLLFSPLVQRPHAYLGLSVDLPSMWTLSSFHTRPQEVLCYLISRVPSETSALNFQLYAFHSYTPPLPKFPIISAPSLLLLVWVRSKLILALFAFSWFSFK